MDMSIITAMMPLLVIGMFILVVFRMVKEMLGSKKKPKMIEIARDSNERMEKAYRRTTKGKLNKDRMRHTLWVSGDKVIQGYRIGDMISIEPNNEMYKMYIKTRWWYVWEKATPIKVDPILCSDLNCKDIVIECRGFSPVSEDSIYPIPLTGTKDLEGIYIGRDNYELSKILKLTSNDLNEDSDVLLKMSMRGDLSSAFSEIERYEEMPIMKEEKVRMHQRKNVEQKMKSGGGE